MMNVALSLDVYEKQIQSGKQKGLLGALQIGKALDKIKEDNLWVQVGAKSFESYASQAHGFSKSTTYNLLSVFRYFGRELIADPSLQSIEPTRLIRLLPHITETNKLELLHSAATIPDTKSFENTIRNLNGKKGTDECSEHDFEIVQFHQCKICGQRRKINA